MYAAGKFQPMPSLPLPPPPSYESPNLGACPAVPGGNCMPTPYLAVPVFKEGWKDSPSPSMEPGPLGTEMALGPTALLSAANKRFEQEATERTASSHGWMRPRARRSHHSISSIGWRRGRRLPREVFIEMARSFMVNSPHRNRCGIQARCPLRN